MTAVESAVRNLRRAIAGVTTETADTITVARVVPVAYADLDALLTWYAEKTRKPRRAPRKAKATTEASTARKSTTTSPVTTTDTKKPAAERRPASRRAKS